MCSSSRYGRTTVGNVIFLEIILTECRRSFGEVSLTSRRELVNTREEINSSLSSHHLTSSGGNE